MEGVTSCRADTHARIARAESRRAQTAEQEVHTSRDDYVSLAADLALDRGLGLCEQGKVGEGILWLARTLEIAPPGSDLHPVVRANLADWRRHLPSLAMLFQHQGDVYSIAFSADGSHILTVDWGGIARLWDAVIARPAAATKPPRLRIADCELRIGTCGHEERVHRRRLETAGR